MIDTRLRVADVQRLMSCSRQTAARYMRMMVHTEDPLTVTEEAFREWEQKRTIDPNAPTPIRYGRNKARFRPITEADWRVPRRREAK